MAPLDDTTAATRFDSFDVYRTSYKKVGDHEIEVGILIPKALKQGKHPLIAKFHGGVLVTGSNLYPDWFAGYMVPLIHRNNAICVSPNYRFTPEASGDDILEDLADFWKWFHNGGLVDYLASQKLSVELDFEHILVSGESAGGYMGLMSSFTRPEGEIKALHLQYPMTNDLLSPNSATPEEKAAVEEHIASMKTGSVISNVDPPERLVLAFALIKVGRFAEFFGKGKHLWPFTAVEDAKSLPPTLIIHGEQDSAVSIDDTKAFVKKVGELLPKSEINFVARDGDHGFDVDTKEDEEAWLKDALKWAEAKWMA